ncbi:hypothetical protein AN416_37940 (plasmid) [Paraburkholderia caribensis]|nr:hypothetical protein AN416_37940 [Paraburkholderia caribensis]AUT58114.1 alpha/beta hydrolase [Paraburkholderia caribensis]
MFPGGTGDVGIERNGEIRHGDNFVVRTRDLWAQKGYGVLIVDAINHRSIRGKRDSPKYARVVHEILTYARSMTNAPLWIMGTSQGSIAAMLAASTARPGEVAGVVLTESVSVLGRSHETVFDAHPETVRVPALVVANRDDGCWVAPPTDAEAIAKAMSHTRADVLMEEGGKTDSADACSSRTPHGYWGIDDRVVDDITRWMGGADADRRGKAG